MKDEVLDAYLEGLVEIGNDQRVKEVCEPHVMEPPKLEKWMVFRTLAARALLEEKLQKEGSKNVET